MTKRVLADAAGLLLVITATLWVYLPTLSIPLWDDDAWHVYELRNPGRAVRLLFDPAVALEVNWVWFRPLGDLSYTLDYQLWQLDPAGYHLHNLALHCLVAAMLVWFLREWLASAADRRQPQPAVVWLMALAFTLNPITAQTVTRPNMRYDLYATLLILVALLAVRLWQRGVWPWGRILSLGATFGAYASKESALVVLPLVALLSEGAIPRRLRMLWPFAGVWLLYVAWRVSVTKGGVGGYVWLEWSWRDLLDPSRHLMVALALARAGWGSPWALGAVLLGPLTMPRLGLLAALAFVITLLPLIPFGRGVTDASHYFYPSLAIFFLGLGTGLAGLERWTSGRAVSFLGLLVLTWLGFRGIEPVLMAEARLGEERRAPALSLARQPQAPPGVTDYFLAEGTASEFYLSRLTALLADTPHERWRALNLEAALVSAGLLEKVEAGAARIFSYDGGAWKDTTTDILTAIRVRLASAKPPPPTVEVTAQGYRLAIRPGVDVPAGFLRVYFNRTGEPGIYGALIRVPARDIAFSVPAGRYVITAAYVTAHGESALSQEVHLTIPAGGE